jgi:hypothetical protein
MSRCAGVFLCLRESTKDRSPERRTDASMRPRHTVHTQSIHYVHGAGSTQSIHYVHGAVSTEHKSASRFSDLRLAENCTVLAVETPVSKTVQFSSPSSPRKNGAQIEGIWHGCQIRLARFGNISMDGVYAENCLEQFQSRASRPRYGCHFCDEGLA